MLETGESSDLKGHVRGQIKGPISPKAWESAANAVNASTASRVGKVALARPWLAEPTGSGPDFKDHVVWTGRSTVGIYLRYLTAGKTGAGCQTSAGLTPGEVRWMNHAHMPEMHAAHGSG